VQHLQTRLQALTDILNTLTRQHQDAVARVRQASNDVRDVLEHAVPLARQVREAQTRVSELRHRIHEAERLAWVLTGKGAYTTAMTRGTVVEPAKVIPGSIMLPGSTRP
jgi:predicted RNase H-like nuclease (RuvC/YqgF family)